MDVTTRNPKLTVSPHRTSYGSNGFDIASPFGEIHLTGSHIKRAQTRQIPNFDRSSSDGTCITCGKPAQAGEALEQRGKVRHVRITIDAWDGADAILCLTPDMELVSVSREGVLRGTPDENGFINPA